MAPYIPVLFNRAQSEGTDLSIFLISLSMLHMAPQDLPAMAVPVPAEGAAGYATAHEGQ